MKRLLYILGLSLFISSSFADELNSQGLRPFISYTHDVNSKWSFNLFYADTIKLSNEKYKGSSYPAHDLQSYLQLGLTYHKSKQLNYTFGYVYQRGNPWYQDYVNENRLWQQINYTHSVPTGMLAHRFRFEERFIENPDTKKSPLTTRLRYRLQYTYDFIDHKTDFDRLYFATYNEFYFDTTKSNKTNYNSDWIYAGIGFKKKNSKHQIEIGPLVQWSKGQANNNQFLYLIQLGVSY